MLRGFGVSSVEVCYKSLHALDVIRWSPLIFLNAIPFPTHKVLKFTSKDPAIKNMFYFIFFNPVTDYGEWWVMLYSFSEGEGDTMTVPLLQLKILCIW